MTLWGSMRGVCPPTHTHMFTPCQVLSKSIFKQGPRSLIHIGDKDIDYDPEFRLYLATSIANPHFLPEVSVQVRWGPQEGGGGRRALLCNPSPSNSAHRLPVCHGPQLGQRCGWVRAGGGFGGRGRRRSGGSAGWAVWVGGVGSPVGTEGGVCVLCVCVSK
jgi:hypothetical protein